MIIELCKIKLRTELWSYKGKLDLILKVTLFFLAVFYGVIIGLGIEMSDFEDIDLIKITLVFVFSMSLFRYYFPIYKAKVNYFSTYHPVSRILNFLMYCGLDLCTMYWLNMMVFVVTILIVQEVKDFIFALDILGAMFLALMIHRIIQHITESKITILGKSSIILMLLCGISCYYYLPYFQFFVIYPTVLFIAIYFLEFQIRGLKSKNKLIFIENVFVKLFFNNALAANLFVLSLIFQIFNYGYIILFSEKSNFFEYVSIFMPWMPIFYLNFYGIFKSLFLVNHQSIQDYSWSRAIMLKILLIPYSIHSILLLPFAYYHYEDPIFIWSSYIGLTLLITGISPIYSMFQPYKMNQMMEQKFDWRIILIGSIVMSCTSVLYLVQFYNFAMIIHCLIIGIIIANLLILPSLYIKGQYNIWNKLK